MLENEQWKLQGDCSACRKENTVQSVVRRMNDEALIRCVLQSRK